MINFSIKSIALQVVIFLVIALTVYGISSSLNNQPHDLSALAIPMGGDYKANGMSVKTDVANGGSSQDYSYNIDQWGVKINLKANDKFEVKRYLIIGDNSLLVETKAYDQLAAISGLNEQDFRNCVQPLLTVSRIEVDKTSNNPKAKPWWTNRKELDINGKKIGNFYYYRPARTTSCVKKSVLEEIYPPLTVESTKLFDWLGAVK